MADAYIPTLEDLSLSENEKTAIEVALGQANAWDHDCAELSHVKADLVSAKNKLVDHHLARHRGTCCYCRTVLAGTGPFQRDREHILPKGKFPELSYDPANLSVSCKRCNMEYKKEKTDFVLNEATILLNYEDPTRYFFIHPNFDRYEDYIMRTMVQAGASYVVTYAFISQVAKAQFTFDFFNLGEIQKDNWDAAQGLAKVREITDSVEARFPNRV